MANPDPQQLESAMIDDAARALLHELGMELEEITGRFDRCSLLWSDGQLRIRCDFDRGYWDTWVMAGHAPDCKYMIPFLIAFIRNQKPYQPVLDAFTAENRQKSLTGTLEFIRMNEKEIREFLAASDEASFRAYQQFA